MAEARQFQIQWADYLVEHFSSFFSKQWDEQIDRVFAAQSLPDYALSYTTAALQEVMDCATVSAKQALISGFTPSLNYSKVLSSELRCHPPECRRAIQDAVQAILDSDRRDYSKRSGLVSLGDYFFEGLRRVLRTSIPDDSLDDHYATACYFGRSGYHGMVAHGVSPDLLLLNYAAQDRRYAVSARAVAGFADGATQTASIELCKLEIVPDNLADPGSLQDIVFSDCEFAPGAVDVGDQLVLQDCVLAEKAFRQCIHSRFKDCSRRSIAPNPLLAESESDEPFPSEFHDCVFEGGFFEPDQAAVQLHDCRFFPPQLECLQIDRLSGDCSPLDISGCDIGTISPGSSLGYVSSTRVHSARQVHFDNSLTDVVFSGTIERCVFGGEQETAMTRVRFGPDSTPDAGVAATDRSACRVSNSLFGKGLHFDGVTFDCRLQDPVFNGDVVGIRAIRELVLSRKVKKTFQSVDFGLISSRGEGGLQTLVGGRIFKLDAQVDHLSHTLVRSIGVHGRVGKYEVVADPSVRRQWQIKSGPILIGRVEGRIDELTLMGDEGEAFAIGAVSGSINSFQPGVKIQRLLDGGEVVFAHGSDVDKALSEHRIAAFNGGHFGVWERRNGDESLRYFCDEQEYRQRDRIDDVVKGIFDALG